jgi:hypothetical protein
MNDNEPMLPIAFYVELILNRLRNEREIQESNRSYEQPRDQGYGDDNEPRAGFENKRAAEGQAASWPTGRKIVG